MERCKKQRWCVAGAISIAPCFLSHVVRSRPAGGRLEELPLSKRFGDVVIIRTGFKEDDTMITFKSGVHWGFHSQLDHGSFTIYKGQPAGD